jgi:hypothetical protein
MDARQMFKFACISRCLDAGMTGEQMLQSVTNWRASLEKRAEGLVPYVGGALLAAPVALGGVTALAKNVLTDSNAVDTETAKQEELSSLYARMASQLRQQQEMRKYQQQRKRSARYAM